MRLYTCLFILLALTQNALASPKSSVWKAERGNDVLYLGGTVHLLSAKDLPLPTVFSNAYDAADALVFEMDLSEFQQPDIQRQVQQLQILSEGIIQDLISPQMHTKLQQYFQSKGMSVERFERFKPGFIAMTMTMLELRNAGFSQEGVDQLFYQRAKQQGKPLYFFETALQQIQFIADMGKGYEDDFFQYTLDDIADLESQIAPLVSAWRQGNMKQLEQLSLQSMAEEFPDVYQEIIVKRNHAWLIKLLDFAETKEVEFVLGGVLHFPGQDGILQLLRDHGFRITQLEH